MYCQPFNITSPILQAGEYFEVSYKPQSSINWLSFLPNPNTQNFDICNLVEDVYDFKITKVDTLGNKCAFNNGSFIIGPNIWQIIYVNNVLTQNIELVIGGSTEYTGLYSQNPLSGIIAILVNQNVDLLVPNKVITSATCNGITITPNSNLAQWANVNGSCFISFTTATNGTNSVFAGGGDSFNGACTGENFIDNVYFQGIFELGTQLFIDPLLTILLSTTTIGTYIADVSTGMIYEFDANTSRVGIFTGNIC